MGHSHMPNGEGWFIDLKNGEHIRISEHRFAVVADPVRYRVTPDEIAGKCRDEILSLVLSRGFVRVRADREWLVAEFNAPASEALPVIKGFLEENGFVGYRQLRIRDHLQRRQLECMASELLNSRFREDQWQAWPPVSKAKGTK